MRKNFVITLSQKWNKHREKYCSRALELYFQVFYGQNFTIQKSLGLDLINKFYLRKIWRSKAILKQ